MHYRFAALLTLALATTLLAGTSHAQQRFTSEQQANLAIEKITAQANARIAAGEPEAAVEAWMTQAMTQTGMAVKKQPESWDVYGQASWDQEVSQDEEIEPEYRDSEGADTIGGLPTRGPVDGRQQTDSETQGRGNEALRTEASNEGLGDRIRDRSGGHAKEQGNPPTTDYVFKGRLGAASPAQLENGIHDTRVFEEGEKALPRSGSSN